MSIKATSSTGRLKMAFMRLESDCGLTICSTLLFTNVNTLDAKKRRKKKKKNRRKLKLKLLQWDYCHACITVVDNSTEPEDYAASSEFRMEEEKALTETNRTISCNGDLLRTLQ